MNTRTIPIVEIFKENANEEYAKRMSAYMKNYFPFLGIPKPKRVELSKLFMQEKLQHTRIDWQLIFDLYELNEREYQYLALEYLSKMQKHLVKADISKLEHLLIQKSWWDTVDSLASIVGFVCIKYPELKKEVLQIWMISSNIWLKRVSIIFQLKYKTEVDTQFLAKAILANHLSKEFFIKKAIGWALRQYSKYNPDWVRKFISQNSLSPLSIREGSKYL